MNLGEYIAPVDTNVTDNSTDTSGAVDDSEEELTEPDPIMLIHGWIMWVAWSILGFI